MSRGLKIALIIVAVGAIASGIAMSVLNGNTVFPGVSVSGIGVGGLTVEQAESRLQPLAAQYASQEFALRYREGSIKTTVADMGGEIDIPAFAKAAFQIGRKGNIVRRIAQVISAQRRGLNIPPVFTFDEKAAAEWLSAESEKVGRKPINASLVVEGNTVTAMPGKAGIEIDTKKSLERIVEAINSGTREADLVTVIAQPKISIEDFRGIDGVVASYSTPYKPWQRDRSHNLRIACRAINGTLIKPSEVFSYNKVVGPRLKKFGFRDALMFVNGEVEAGTGGGVCQVSTTMYNTALLADMKIVRRQHHSQPVHYAPVGRDATVAYPALDFRFKNTSDAPIYIMASVGKRTVNITFLGKPINNRQVVVTTEGHKIIPAPAIQKVDDTLEPGKSVVEASGRSGHRIAVYRITKVGGAVVKRELISNDYYRPGSKVTAVGPAPM